MGMALEESTDGLEQLESGGVTAWIDPGLKEFLTKYGQISIDYVDSMGNQGFMIRVGSEDCSSKGCDGCG